MSSTNKTEKVGLNQYLGTDHFKRYDYNQDMSKIDSALKQLDEPIIPSVNGSELSITAHETLKKIPIKITSSVTGTITIKKNGAAAKPLKLPSGEAVTGLTNEVMFYEIFEETEAFIYAPKSGGVQFADKSDMTLKTLSTSLSNYTKKTIPSVDSIMLVSQNTKGQYSSFIKVTYGKSFTYSSIDQVTGDAWTMVDGKMFKYNPSTKTMQYKGTLSDSSMPSMYITENIIVHDEEIFVPIKNDNNYYIGKWSVINLSSCIYKRISPINGYYTFPAAMKSFSQSEIICYVEGYNKFYKINNSKGGSFSFSVKTPSASARWKNGSYVEFNNRNYMAKYSYSGTVRYEFYNSSGTSIVNVSKGSFVSGSTSLNGGIYIPELDYVLFDEYYSKHYIVACDSNGNKVWEYAPPENYSLSTPDANSMYVFVKGVYVYIIADDKIIKVDARDGTVVYVFTKPVWAGATAGQYPRHNLIGINRNTEEIVCMPNYYVENGSFQSVDIYTELETLGHHPNVDLGKVLLLNTTTAKSVQISKTGETLDFETILSGQKIEWNPTILVGPDDVSKLEKYIKVK